MTRFNKTRSLTSLMAAVMLLTSTGSAWAGDGSTIGEAPKKCDGINWPQAGQKAGAIMADAGLLGIVAVGVVLLSSPNGMKVPFTHSDFRRLTAGSLGLAASGGALLGFSNKKAKERAKECTGIKAVSTRTAANEPVHAPMAAAATSGVTSSAR